MFFIYSTGSARFKCPLGRAAMYQFSKDLEPKAAAAAWKGLFVPNAQPLGCPSAYMSCGNSYVKLVIWNAFFAVSMYDTS